eukprot:1355433-Rhodomonas_salina.4
MEGVQGVVQAAGAGSTSGVHDAKPCTDIDNVTTRRECSWQQKVQHASTSQALSWCGTRSGSYTD